MSSDLEAVAAGFGDLQIWPFGHGALVTAFGVTDDTPIFVIRPVPDGLTRDEGGNAASAWEASHASGAPQCFLTFKDADAIDGLIAQLAQLSEAAKALKIQTLTTKDQTNAAE